ncbi:ketosteroid isomerase-like protein [Burkholderia ambifaria]
MMGDWAYLRNFLEIDVTPPGGDTVRRSGHTLTIFRKSDGRWQLTRDANLVTLAH